MFRNPKLLSVLMIGALSLGLSGTASAQIFGISFEKSRRGKSFDIRIGGGHRHVHRRGHRHSDCCRQWIAPRCETVRERVWVEGRCERVWCPPEYRWERDRCGARRRVCIRQGHYRTVNRPGHHRWVERQVTHPGRYEYTCGY